MQASSEADRVSLYITAPDGLRLHYLEYGSRADSGVPVVCLPGLARTADDFGRLARALAAPASGKRRRVLALDYRGRGRSAWDTDVSHYSLPVEHGDILTTLAAAEITNAIFIGTSRGGMHVMVLAGAAPGLIRAAVINDIGPVLERSGLMRIKSYVGKLPRPNSWGEAVEILKSSAGAFFTSVPDADWETFARSMFNEENGQLKVRYDPALTHTLDAFTEDSPLPDLWPQFETLAKVPALGIRGENSDLLSPETFVEMARRHPAFESHIVRGQGHAPLLLDAPTISVIADFVNRVG